MVTNKHEHQKPSSTLPFPLYGKDFPAEGTRVILKDEDDK